MKKIVLCLFVLIMAICIFALPVSANEEISVFLDGEMVEFDVQPQIINGRTMVPMRKIFESLGATVEWENSTKKITAKRQDKTIVMQIDNTVLFVNGNSITLDVPPQLVDGRTLVPVRAVAESFENYVEWDGDANTVIISSKEESHIHTYNDEFICTICEEVNKTDMYALLKYWIHTYGEAKGECASVFVPIDDGLYSSFTVNHNVSDDSLYISYFTENGTLDISTDNYICMIYLTSDGEKYRYTAAYGNPPEGCEGIIDANNYTTKSPLPCSKYYGDKNNRIWFVEYTREKINSMLSCFDILLYDCLAESNISDFGFMKFD